MKYPMLIGLLGLLVACQSNDRQQSSIPAKNPPTQSNIDTLTVKSAAPSSGSTTPYLPLVASARSQIGVTTGYDPTYRTLAFPMGDVNKNTGVCTDVVIRAYREQGKDLQALINTDMKANWDAYPKIWGLPKPDTNIDHRRVPNLEVFFARHGKTLSISDKASYQAGDLVTWRLPQASKQLPHIGIVSDKKSGDGTPLIIHNIGHGTEESDILYQFPISGHFRY